MKNRKNAETILNYHHVTKHQPYRFAQGPGQLDWSCQPNPFRTFEGAKKIELPLGAEPLEMPYGDLYTGAPIKPREVNLESISLFFRLSMGLSAWKEYGDSKWALRCNPSSGNLHAEEAYLVKGGGDDFWSGVYHYDVFNHALEQRTIAPYGLVEIIHVDEKFIAGLSSIHWREAWKYGERAYRYCQLDTGHALAAMRFAARMLGWRAALITECMDEDVETMLGLNRPGDYIDAERESPEALILITRGDDQEISADDTAQAARFASSYEWKGGANRLSPPHNYEWPIIDEAAIACGKHEPDGAPVSEPCETGEPVLPAPSVDAAHIITTRRSGQAYDGQTAMPADVFFRMIDATLPRPGISPWDMFDWEPLVHPVFFVHRVDGLEPGLYVLARDPGAELRLQDAMSEEFLWAETGAAPERLPFWLLKRGNFRDTAAAISCRQDIAGDGAFSLGMLAEFEDEVKKRPWAYRYLHWEAGALGHVLYLEAEAAGFRATGIGCYFDDVFHETLGLKDEKFQSLYHLTVGKPVEDARISTLAPYHHINR